MAFDLNETFCRVLYQEALPSLTVENSLEDPRFASLSPTREIGIRSYSGISLYRPDGTPYGTLCTLDLAPRQVSAEEVALLSFAGRIAMQVVETKEHENRLRTLVTFAPVSTAILDAQGIFEAVNKMFAEMLEYTPEELVGQPFHLLFPQSQRLSQQEAYNRQVATAAQGMRDETLLTRAGDPRPVRIAAMQFPGTSGRSHRLWYVTDLSVQQAQQARIFHATGQDVLTGLENRAPFVRRLDAAVLGGEHGVVLFVNLDAFKAVNDVLGYEAGDFVLSTVAKRLRNRAQPNDVAARLGGDEFAVLLAGITNEAEAEIIARNIMTQVAMPIVVMGQWVRVTMSVGMALFPQHGEDGSRLVQAAEAAMHRVKQEGKHGIASAGRNTLEEYPQQA